MKQLELLGCKVKEKTTGYEGVVTSVSFDLVGCIMGFVTPPHDAKKAEDVGRWYDCARLDVGKRVMPSAFNLAPPGRSVGATFKSSPTRGHG